MSAFGVKAFQAEKEHYCKTLKMRKSDYVFKIEGSEHGRQ